MIILPILFVVGVIYTVIGVFCLVFVGEGGFRHFQERGIDEDDLAITIVLCWPLVVASYIFLAIKTAWKTFPLFFRELFK